MKKPERPSEWHGDRDLKEIEIPESEREAWRLECASFLPLSDVLSASPTTAKTRTTVLGDAGDLSATPGSERWAVAVRLQLWANLNDHRDAENRLRKWCEIMRGQEGWKVLTDREGRSFVSWEAFCAHPKPEGLGLEAAEPIDATTREGHQTSLEQLTRLWMRLSDTDRHVFLQWVAPDDADDE